MSVEYDEYLKNHINGVKHAASWLIEQPGHDPQKVLDILPELPIVLFPRILNMHDASKITPEEYNAYNEYFYGTRTLDVIERFNRAFLHHIHHNSHHWQHWVLVNDDGNFEVTGKKTKAIEIPDQYIFEMICDWWSFSWNEYAKATENRYEKLYGIFDWYRDHEGAMLLGYETRLKVEKMLDLIKTYLDDEKPE